MGMGGFASVDGCFRAAGEGVVYIAGFADEPSKTDCYSLPFLRYYFIYWRITY